MKELTDIEVLVIAGTLCECYGSDTQIGSISSLAKVGLFSKIMSIILCYPVKAPATYSAHDHNDFDVAGYYECRRQCCNNGHKQYKYHEEIYYC